MAAELDLHDARVPRAAPPALARFCAAGVLQSADVHVAQLLGRLAAEQDPDVLLAAALAVRGPRSGHVLVDLASIAKTVALDESAEDVAALPWPEPEPWLRALRASALCDPDRDDAPLRLEASGLYLDRYWREERRLAEDLRSRDAPVPGVREDALRDGLRRLFGPGADPAQRTAAETAVRRRFSVVAGGPGTGKTTTVARIVALLLEQAGDPSPLVALAAPTGKAAARLQEAVGGAAGDLDVDGAVAARLAAVEAFTLHRLLGWRPGSHSRFRHHRDNRLPHEVVIVDESSMVSLSLMARLVEAVRPDARLVLVGDPGQLTSIEAGAVLGDIVAAGGPGIAGLTTVHRHGGAIAALARAVRDGDADAAVDILGSGAPDVSWLPAREAGQLEQLAVEAGRGLLAACRAGDGDAALQALDGLRVLTAHRRGPDGAATWSARIEQRVTEAVGSAWSIGRPLLMTENDHALGLFNGDTGAIVAGPDGAPEAVFRRGGRLEAVAPSRLGAADTVYAMTIHKSQGSQFDTAAVLLPPQASALLSRELLYTAVTRARTRLVLCGDEDVVRAAIARPAARASGLRARLQASPLG